MRTSAEIKLDIELINGAIVRATGQQEGSVDTGQTRFSHKNANIMDLFNEKRALHKELERAEARECDNTITGYGG